MTKQLKQLYARLIKPQTQIALSLDEVAQASHVAIAAAVVGLVSARWHGQSKFIAAVLVVILAAVKEFWFDKNYEDAATRGSDFEDWSYYCVGAIVALLILWGAG
jgi:1,4-dihydroxy-2-naphthoate octaprenyltransferase